MNLLRDVYRDLRDRRLLSIAIVLIAAMIAVPFLVRSDSEPTSGATAAALGAPVEGADVLEPVVTSADTELRDYERRLDQFQRKNPFKQQLTQPLGGSLTDTSVSTDSGGGTATSPTTDAGSGLGGEIVEDASVTETSTTETSGGTETVTEDATVEEETSTEETEEPEETGGVLYSTRVDVRVGPVGKTKVLRDVKELTYLPDKDAPVVQLLFGEFDLGSAAFVVSPAAVATEGTGRCAPSPQACQFLLLKKGKEQRFDYDGTTYSLQLLDVDLHEESLEGAFPVDDEEAASAGFAADRSGEYLLDD